MLQEISPVMEIISRLDGKHTSNDIKDLLNRAVNYTPTKIEEFALGVKMIKIYTMGHVDLDGINREMSTNSMPFVLNKIMGKLMAVLYRTERGTGDPQLDLTSALGYFNGKSFYDPDTYEHDENYYRHLTVGLDSELMESPTPTIQERLRLMDMLPYLDSLLLLSIIRQWPVKEYIDEHS